MPTNAAPTTATSRTSTVPATPTSPSTPSSACATTGAVGGPAPARRSAASQPGVVAFEFGAGFAVATARGSVNNDAFVPKGGGRIGTETNRHGGILGGISSGEPIVLRVAIKPTSSLPQPQRTVTRAGEPTEIVTKGRHDPCLLPRFVPMGEAMVAITLADHWLRWRAQCSPR